MVAVVCGKKTRTLIQSIPAVVDIKSTILYLSMRERGEREKESSGTANVDMEEQESPY